MQSKTQSLIESCINVFIGYIVAVASQFVIYPLFDISVSVEENLAIGLYFTMVSLVRGYFVRRWFNSKYVKFRKETQCTK